jgi:hypothetical protein
MPMRLRGLLENRRFLYVVISIAVFSLALEIFNIFMLWGDRGDLADVNSIANVIAAILATSFAGVLWLSYGRSDSLRRLWGLMALGLTMWTIAEVLWLYFGILDTEVPNPSIADFFWVPGYIPFIAAFLMRAFQFRVVQTRLQIWINVLMAVLLIIPTAIFVIWPVVTDYDPTRAVEGILAILYPLADLILLILMLTVLFSNESGRFSLTWRWLGFGFLGLAVSDLMFSYADWNGIYYPDGHANVISILIDVFYYNSYLLIAVGVFIFGMILEMDREVKIATGSTSLTRSSILLFVDRNNRIISFSDNFLSLVDGHDRQRYEKLPLYEALGIDPFAAETFKMQVIEQGSVSNQPLTVKRADGSLKDTWVTGFAIYEAQHQFTNLAIVLRTNLADKAADEPRLQPDQERLVEYYLSKAGTSAREEKDVIKTYFLTQIRLLYSIIAQFSGTKIADGLAGHLNQIAKDKGWQVVVEGQEIMIPDEYDVHILGEVLSSLLKEARLYAARASSAGIVDEEIRRLDQDVKPDALRYIDKSGLRQLQASS